MLFEVLDAGRVIKRFTKILNTVDFETELMDVPQASITLPISYIQYLSGRKEIRITFENGLVFRGAVQSVEADTVQGTIDVSFVHIFHEWEYRQVPTNYAIKDTTIKEMYDDEDIRYGKDWEMRFDQAASEENVDYVYSRQNKLEALTQTVEHTEDLWWRINLSADKVVEIGKFGDSKPCRVSVMRCGPQNIQIIEEPKINEDFSNVVNIATVYGNKSDNGMSALSLREVFEDEELQDAKFPVVILRTGINNERDYQNYQDFPELGPNNDTEYSIIDTESVAMESGIYIEDTFAFEDLSPFSLEDDTSENGTVDTEIVLSGVWSPHEFFDQWNGKSIDIDGVAGAQCVDLWKMCLKTVGYPNPTRPIGGDGYAEWIWYNRDVLGYGPYFDYITPGNQQYGDFAVWSKGGDTPYSHVAMYVGGSSFFGQNQPYPHCDVANIGMGNILGYLRVKKELWKDEKEVVSDTVNGNNGSKPITNEDRIEAAKVAYKTAVKKLINSRRVYQVELTTTAIPADVNVGDKIRLDYDFDEYQLGSCSNYMKKLIALDDWWYIAKLSRSWDRNGVEIGTLTLEKFLRIDREVQERADTESD